MKRTANGFTLTDCSAAIFVSALLFGAIVTPLHTQIDVRKREQTEYALEQARTALLGYAAAHGYFPCPADGASHGQEAAGADHSSGSCPTYYGFLPAAALGLERSDTDGFAVDGWARAENRIRYAVVNQTVGSSANTSAFTRTNGMRTAGIVNLSASTLSLFHVCNSASGVIAGVNCGSAVTLASTTPVVLWSVGSNAASGGTSADEAENPNPNGGSADRVFVSRPRNSVTGSEFDDIVTWIPMPQVISRMLAAGQLP